MSAAVTLPVPRVADRGGCDLVFCDGLATVALLADETALLSFYAGSGGAWGPDNVVVARLALPTIALAQGIARILLAIGHERGRRPRREGGHA